MAPILVVNAGSSTLKLRVLDDGDILLGALDLADPPWRAGSPGTADAASWVADAVTRVTDGARVAAVGHRVVHGGPVHRSPVVVDDNVAAQLASFVELAPLHQPAALAALAAVRSVMPHVPSVACFDTAFHADLPDAAATYALPASWRARWPIRRYGFHGLSHAYAARRGAALAGPGAGSRVVTCHLGAGASLAAVVDGRSVDTTMGFTPLEGLVMATRAGDVDPGLVLWLATRTGLSIAELSAGLERGSGLVGLAGTPDMREVIRRADDPAADGHDAARLAFDVFVHRLRAGIAAMAAAAGGLDVLVFTGGVGERAPAVREAAAAGLGFLGVELDPAANARAVGGGGDADLAIGAPGSRVRTVVVAAREDLEIAREVRALLHPGR